MPFLDAHRRWIAVSHFESGMWLSSKMVPTVAVNCALHARHRQSPLRVEDRALDSMRYDSPTTPHFGQIVPLGHRRASSVSRASSSVSIVRAALAIALSSQANSRRIVAFCQVYNSHGIG